MSLESNSSSYSSLSNAALLRKLIGVRQTQKCYRGSLAEVFASSCQASLPERCVVARELVKRWLAEELKRGCVLDAPGTSVLSFTERGLL